MPIAPKVSNVVPDVSSPQNRKAFIRNSAGRLRLSAQATPKHQTPQPMVPPSIAGIWTMEMGFDKGCQT